MFESNIDINCSYFYMPFGPTTLNYRELGLIKTLDPNIYIDKNKIKWKKCKLYDTGWGKPDGLERIPELEFCDLIKLALLSDYNTSKIPIQDEEANKYGAIALIIDRHIDEMILFLKENMNDPLLSTEILRENLLLFCNKSNETDFKYKKMAELIYKIVKAS